MATEHNSGYIAFEHVYKTYDHPVLVDVNFSLDAGNTLAIIGRSGVGKSVALAHIMGFQRPDQGRIFVSYRDITGLTEAETAPDSQKGHHGLSKRRPFRFAHHW